MSADDLPGALDLVVRRTVDKEWMVVEDITGLCLDFQFRFEGYVLEVLPVKPMRDFWVFHSR